MSIRSFFDSIDIPSRDYVRAINAERARLASVVTFGCQQNEADSERIRGILCDLGFVLSDNPDVADLIIFNTCAIRAHAEDKVLSQLGNYKAKKRNSEDMIVGICGCMAAERGVVERIKNKFHYVDFTLEPHSPHTLPELIRDAMERRRRGFAIGIDDGGITEEIPVVRKSSFSAWVSVMYGCNNFCTYCIVPYVRGRERSRRSEDIIKECKDLVKSGVKEITLLGQNVNSYRSDMSFAELIAGIAEIDGDFIIRFMTSHPKDVSPELISVMQRYTPKIAPYFHLPLQSGSNKILKAMNRTYDRDKFIDTAGRLRDAIPDIVLSTDIIVGFPGEDDCDFEDTLDVLSKVRFDAVYGFIYSERDGTPAARFDGKVPQDARSARLARLFAVQDPISKEKAKAYLGRHERVLVRSVSQNDIADSVTASNKLVRFKAEGTKPGDLVTVKIITAGAYELIAEKIK